MPPRVRKILRNNIHGVSTPVIKRFYRRGGALAVPTPLVEYTRSYLSRIMKAYLHDIIVIADYNKKKTVSTDHFKTALELRNKSLASSKKPNVKACKNAATVYKKITAAKRVEYQQKNTDCLIIPRLPFNRLTREIAQDFETGLAFSSDFLIYFQIFIEMTLSDLTTEAVKHAKHAKRKGVTTEDLDMASVHIEDHLM